MASASGVYTLTPSESTALTYYLSECPYKQPIGPKGLQLTFHEWNSTDLREQMKARYSFDGGSMPSDDQIRRFAENFLKPLA